MGGHNVPEDTIRRRYNKGMNNFFNLYMPLADTWFFYDNSVAGSPGLIASASQEDAITVDNELIWNQIREEYHGG
jgi:predicted ABC-type ATPase